MILHDSQKRIVEDNHRFRVVNAGRRFGKTIVAIEELFFAAVMQETSVAYCAPTYLQARDIAWAMLKKRIQDFSVLDINETRLEMTIRNKKGTISKITLKGWESIESLRGQSFDFLVLDEVAMYRNFWTGWEEVIRPTLVDRKGKVLFISTPRGFNFWYDLYNMQETDTDFRSFHFTAYDNPFLPKEELEKIRSELTDDRFAQEILADFKKTEGLVYKEFDRSKHLFTEIPEGTGIVERIAGADFGFTNPCAIPDIWVDASDTWWIKEEYYERGKTDVQVAEYTAAKRFNAVYPDPEAPAAIAEMRKRGVNVRDVIKGKDSIKNGIDAVRERLKAGKLRVHVSCVNTIMEFETYSYPDKKDLHNEEEKPIDEDNHMMDAIRYPAMMRAARNAKAHVHYADSTLPRNNLTPFQTQQGLPPELQQDKPRYAYTHTPRL